MPPDPSGTPRGPEQPPPGARPRRHRHGRSTSGPAPDAFPAPDTFSAPPRPGSALARQGQPAPVEQHDRSAPHRSRAATDDHDHGYPDHYDQAAAEAPTPPTGWSPVGAATGDQLVATRTAPGRRRRADRGADPATPGTGQHAAGAPASASVRGPVPGRGHGHGHGHSPAPPAGRRVRLLIAALLVPCALATLVGVVLLWPSGGPPSTAQPVSQQPVRAEVTATSAADCSQGSGDGGCVALVVRMADGPMPGRDLVQVVPVEPGSPTFALGDRVVLGWSGADPNDPGSYQVVDFQRGAPLGWLAAVFAGAVLVLGRWRGLAALAALALSFVVLLLFVLPAILAGHSPLAVAVVGSCVIMFVVLYLTHGPSARTSTAVLGTLLSLALIGALGAAFSVAARLTGLDDQTSNLIATLGTGVDARGLLLAGVVIGALGVLDDVTVTQTSAVWELRRANPQLGAPALFTAAMRIGRDHVASAVNTLVLAYAGASLPLLLLFTLSGRGLSDVVTTQDVATEVVRTLVGSIGLVASVPITTALAAVVASREAEVDI